MITPSSTKPAAAFALFSLFSILFFLSTLPGSPMVLTSVSSIQERDAQSSNPYFSILDSVSGLQTGGDNDRSAWMSRLSDDVSITELNLPGTHDSTAKYGGDSYACQSLDLASQLALGVRYFDIRLTLADGILKCQHGRMFQNLEMSNVMETMEKFLSLNPTEGVFLKIQQEHTRYSAVDFSAAVTASLGNSHLIFNASEPITNATVPTMSALRGKMMIMPRFFDLPTLNTVPYEAMTAQDDFKVTLQEKAISIISFYNQIAPITHIMAAVETQTNNTIGSRGLHRTQSHGQLDRARLAQSMNLTWYVNHFSLHNNVESPAVAAYALNPLIADIIPTRSALPLGLTTSGTVADKVIKRQNASAVNKHMGVVLMDFIGVESARLIIESNFI